jgi:hypothetical protein
MDQMQGGMSYELLTEGFMTEGESMTTFMLDYSSVESWEYGKRDTTLTHYPAGKALLTSQRLLLLSCQPTSAANIAVSGTPETGNRNGSVSLTYKAANSVSYRPVPLCNFRAISMMIETSSTGEATIVKKATNLGGCTWSCLGCFRCLNDCCDNSWRGDSFCIATNQRYIELDYEGAWGTDSKLVMRLMIPPTTPVQAVQAWACALQAASPKVMNAGLGAPHMER